MNWGCIFRNGHRLSKCTPRRSQSSALAESGHELTVPAYAPPAAHYAAWTDCQKPPQFRNIESPVSGCSSMVELQLPKLLTWVRFPSPAPIPKQYQASRGNSGGGK